MSLFELYPLILFAFSIIFMIVLHIQKSHKLNLNEVKKTIREESDKAIKKVDQKVVETEEIVNIKKVEAEETCSKVNSRIQELKADSEELDQLRDALYTYRNMLAQLNVATDQTHSYIIQINDDAIKLQNLEILIDKQETKTYEILNSFDIGIKEQEFQLQNLETELHNQTETAINEILKSRDDSLSRISDQIEKYQSLFDTCNQIQLKHDVILKELLNQQNVYETKIVNINKEFNNRVTIMETNTKSNLDKYLAQIEITANDKFFSIEKENLKSFENSLKNKKEETLLNFDRVLQSSVKIINEYNNTVQLPSKAFINNQSIDCETNKLKEVETLSLLDKNDETAFIENINFKNKKNSNLVKNYNNKNMKKDSFCLVDILELEPNLEEVIKKEHDSEKLYEFEYFNTTELDKVVGKHSVIEELNLDQLEKIESLPNSYNEPVEEVVIGEPVNDLKNYQFSEQKEEYLNSDIEEIDRQIIKFNGTGFGTLLNSYGTNKKQINKNESTNSEPKLFKPGSILEKLVEKGEKSDKKESVFNSSDDKYEDYKQKTICEIENPSKNTTFEPIGEEEVILLD
ncbi:MAG: hypothetical protein JJE21_02520 [Spirochaetaceae bacterium]|nr:hypothetical protein [Spirochaetaceae bacterium]